MVRRIEGSRSALMSGPAAASPLPGRTMSYRSQTSGMKSRSSAAAAARRPRPTAAMPDAMARATSRWDSDSGPGTEWSGMPAFWSMRSSRTRVPAPNSRLATR
jgi:hypothetical protein